MKPEDVSRVVEIDRLSFSLPWSERSYRYDLQSNPAARLWVADCIHDDGANLVIGMIAVWLIIDEVHIGTIAVHPDYRRLGIGKRLLETAMQNLVIEGAESFTLEVRRSNIAAQTLYLQMGFREVGVRKRYYQDNGEDALLMVLEKKES